MDIKLPKFKFARSCGGTFATFAQNISALQMTMGNRDFFRQVLQSVAYKKELLFTNLADVPGDITDGKGKTTSLYKGRAGRRVIVNEKETGLTIEGLEDEGESGGGEEGGSGYLGMKFACLGGPASAQVITNAAAATVLQLNARYGPDPEGWCDGAQYRIVVPDEGYYIAFAYAHFSYPVNAPVGPPAHTYPYDWSCSLHLRLQDDMGTGQDSVDSFQQVYSVGTVSPAGNDAVPYAMCFPYYNCQPNWYWEVTVESNDNDGDADGAFADTQIDWAVMAVLRIR